MSPNDGPYIQRKRMLPEEWIAMIYWAFALLVLLPIAASAQNKPNSAAAKPKFSHAGLECREYIEHFSGKTKDAIIADDLDRSYEIRSTLEECMAEHSGELTKRHVVSAALVIQWLSAEDLTGCVNSYAGLKAKFDSLVQAKASAAATKVLTISPIPIGFTRDLYLRGGTLRCSMDGPMRLECKKYVEYLGYTYDSSMIAMIAEEKSGNRYLIGCPPSHSCAPLVPGQYPFEWAGSDAVAIGGLVTEGDKDSQPTTGVYSVLIRNP
jgi:hypothetical protein